MVNSSCGRNTYFAGNMILSPDSWYPTIPTQIIPVHPSKSAASNLKRSRKKQVTWKARSGCSAPAKRASWIQQVMISWYCLGAPSFFPTRLNIVVLPRDFSPEGPGLARQGSASMSSMSFCVYWPKPWFAEKKSLSPIHWTMFRSGQHARHVKQAGQCPITGTRNLGHKKITQ